MKIEVYGTGCPNCRRLEESTRAAVANLGLDAEVVKVEEIRAMSRAGVMRTPALGIDGRLVLQGKVPPPPELMEILRTAGEASGAPAAEGSVE